MLTFKQFIIDKFTETDFEDFHLINHTAKVKGHHISIDFGNADDPNVYDHEFSVNGHSSADEAGVKDPKHRIAIARHVFKVTKEFHAKYKPAGFKYAAVDNSEKKGQKKDKAYKSSLEKISPIKSFKTDNHGRHTAKFESFKQFIREQEELEERQALARAVVGTARRMIRISDEGKRFKDMDEWHKHSVKTEMGTDTPLSRIEAHVDASTHRQKYHHPGDGNSPLIQYLRSRGHQVIRKSESNRGEHFAINVAIPGKPKPKPKKFKMRVN